MKNYSNLVLLAAFIGLFVVFIARPVFVGPPAIDEAHAFQTGRALERLERILGDEAPHPVDSAANDRVRDRLFTEIINLGFDPVVKEDFSCSTEWGQTICARIQNVLFWVTEPGPDAVMISSHYDSVPAGPGASDDGAGIAASLEIASILKGRDLKRPLLVLITDGEEAGLLGAKSFVESDPIAQLVGAVVNLEARGVSGPVSMFQTGRPNGNEIAALANGVKLPATNSLAADIYEVMPNDTDLTEFMGLNIDALNYAFVEGARFYHTPEDNLANMAHRTLFHVGASALASVEALETQTGENAEAQFIFSDVFGAFLISLPQAWGLPLLVISGLVLLGNFVAKRGQSPLRSALFPLGVIIAGVALAVGVTFLISLTRAETSFATAHPWALRGAQTAAALFALLFGLMAFCRKGSQDALLLSGWVWTSVFAGIATFFLPGAAVLFIPSLLLVSIASAGIWLKAIWVFRAVSVLASMILVAMLIPMASLGETALFIENAAPFVIILLIIAVGAIPVCLPCEDLTRKDGLVIAGVLFIALAICSLSAIFLSAFSSSQPRHTSILHAQSDGNPGQSFWTVASRDGLPKEMMASHAFEYGKVDGLPGQRFFTPAPAFSGNELTVSIALDGPAGEAQLLNFDVIAPEADIIWVTVSQGDFGPGKLSIQGRPVDLSQDKIYSLACQGRSCRDLTLSAEMPERYDVFTLNFIAVQYGLGAESDAILDARPQSAVPEQWGDLRTRSVEITVPGRG